MFDPEDSEISEAFLFNIMPKKLTHEEFLEKLWEKNEHYRNCKFEVISTYKNYYAPVMVKDKYGVCKVSYTQLINNNYIPSIISALNKTEYFKNEILELNLHYQNKKFEIIGDYTGRQYKITTLDKYGLCNTNVSSLLSGYMTGIESAIDKEDYYYNILKERNPRIAELLIVKEYKAPKVKVESVYGELIAYQDSIIEWEDLSIQSATNKSDFWIRRAKDRIFLSENICYDKCKYEDNKTQVSLRCIEHNYNYTQRPSHHMANVQGCPHCATSVIKYSEENFEKHREFFKDRRGIMYLLRLDGNGESFYKVGITGRDKKYRISSLSLNYNIKILYEEENTIEECFRLEQNFLKDFEQYKYEPKIKFKGYTECLTINPIEAYYWWEQQKSKSNYESENQEFRY